MLEKRIDSHLTQSNEFKNDIKALNNTQMNSGQKRTKRDIERIKNEIAQLTNEKATLETKLIQRKNSFFRFNFK